jgi:hypothetical protein
MRFDFISTEDFTVGVCVDADIKTPGFNLGQIVVPGDARNRITPLRLNSTEPPTDAIVRRTPVSEGVQLIED